MSLTSLPLELFDKIVLDLVGLEPLGPPSVLFPLLLTCRDVHAHLAPTTTNSNSSLYSQIYHLKFNSNAFSRRAFNPLPSHYANQLWRNLDAMRIIRHANVYPDQLPVINDDDDDNSVYPGLDLVEALQVAVIMMLEDDGKNVRQLLLWANAYNFAKALVKRRLYENAHLNSGWPDDGSLNSYAVWLMWLLTSEETLLRESPQERLEISQLMLPFVYAPMRYPLAHAPANHYHIPPNTNTNALPPATIPSPHGPYPIYPNPDAVQSIVHYTSFPLLTPPLISIAAKLLFLARTEVTPLPIAPHLLPTRAARRARGLYDVAPTREDVEEINWGWGVRLPLGAGLRSREGEVRCVWNEEEEVVRYLEGGAGGRGVAGFPERSPPVQVPPPPPAPGAAGPLPPAPAPAPRPHPRWIGKAPHSRYRHPSSKPNAVITTKSARWDADWHRLRMCGNLYRKPPRVPYGKVYKERSLEGLWQGRMMVPSEQAIQSLINNPNHPVYGTFTEESMGGVVLHVFVRFVELHGVVGEIGGEGEESEEVWMYDEAKGVDEERDREWDEGVRRRKWGAGGAGSGSGSGPQLGDQDHAEDEDEDDNDEDEDDDEDDDDEEEEHENPDTDDNNDNESNESDDEEEDTLPPLPQPFALGPQASHDGMNNAWFAGPLGGVRVSYGDSGAASAGAGAGSGRSGRGYAGGVGGAGEGADDRAYVHVGNERGVYRVPALASSSGRSGMGTGMGRRLGNDAFVGGGGGGGTTSSSEFEFDEEEEEESGSSINGSRYPHDPSRCQNCQDRMEFARRLERAARVHAREVGERIVGGGRGFGAGAGAGDEEEDDEEYLFDSLYYPDSLMDAWDSDDPPYGIPSFASSFSSNEGGEGEGENMVPTHDWSRRARGSTTTTTTTSSTDKTQAKTQTQTQTQPVCPGIKEIMLVGTTDPAHAQAWHAYRWYGRVRPWDGLVALLRAPIRDRDGFGSRGGGGGVGGGGDGDDELGSGVGMMVFLGYLVGGETFVGNWRMASADPGSPAWEGAFCMSRRED